MEPAPIFATPRSLSAVHDRALPFGPCLPDQSASVLHFTPHATAKSYPTAQDWVKYGAVIQELYIQQGLTLRQVDLVMRETYDFHATDKMYKDRLALWEAGKNYTEADYHHILQSVLHSTAPIESITVHDRPVDWPRVKRRLSNAKKPLCDARTRRRLLSLIRESLQTLSNASAGQDSVLIEAPSLDLVTSAQVTLHYSDRELEVLLSSLNEYITRHFYSSKGAHYFSRPEANRPACAGPSMYGRPFSDAVHPAEFNQNYTRALKLLATNHVAAGFRLLDQASALVQQILQQEHPALISSLIATLAGHDAMESDLVRDHIAELTCSMSNIVLGPAHTITRLCQYLKQHRETERIIDFWRRYSAIFSDKFCRSHRLSIYVNQKLFEKLLNAEHYEEAQSHIEANLDPVFDPQYRHEHSPKRVSPACLCYIRRKARLLRCLGRFSEAIDLHQTLITLLKQSSPCNGVTMIKGNSVFEEAFRMAEEVAVLYEHASSSSSTAAVAAFSTGQALKAHTFALEVCLLVRGPSDGKTSTLVSAHEKRLTDVGRARNVELLRKRFPAVFAGEEPIEEQMGTETGFGAAEDVNRNHESNISDCVNCKAAAQQWNSRTDANQWNDYGQDMSPTSYQSFQPQEQRRRADSGYAEHVVEHGHYRSGPNGEAVSQMVDKEEEEADEGHHILAQLEGMVYLLGDLDFNLV